MAGRYPDVQYTEQGMREGMQIEDANISIDDKVALLDALSDTGLKRIVVGSFVSPRYTPQMARIDELLKKFHPKEGVIYTALALNERGVERAREYSPPLTVEGGGGPALLHARPTLNCHMCDVFTRRNTNRSQMQEMSAWPRIIATAQERQVKEAGIGANASFGSNFLGDFTVDMYMRLLEKQHELWDDAGIKVTQCSMGDPMSWCHPNKVEAIIYRVKEKWPEITHWSAHLHNARGMAITSMYAALASLGPEDNLALDGTIGGFGGCPYCGNGRATGMAPTEDVIHMMEDMGIDMGVDLDKLIECVWMAEEILGRQLWGHVSRAGPRPKAVNKLYNINAPFVETLEQAKHFITGPKAYEGGVSPWREPITSPYRDRVESGLPAFEVDGNWPWNEDFFPKPSD
ncbi:citramalate synthase [Dehalococcoidia bacterium]|nr:citramalate synthase [Dehalococcoidia bacterium]